MISTGVLANFVEPLGAVISIPLGKLIDSEGRIARDTNVADPVGTKLVGWNKAVPDDAEAASRRLPDLRLRNVAPATTLREHLYPIL
jgi:hypothetical protein